MCILGFLKICPSSIHSDYLCFRSIWHFVDFQCLSRCYFSMFTLWSHRGFCPFCSVFPLAPFYGFVVLFSLKLSFILLKFSFGFTFYLSSMLLYSICVNNIQLCTPFLNSLFGSSNIKYRLSVKNQYRFDIRKPLFSIL